MPWACVWVSERHDTTPSPIPATPHHASGALQSSLLGHWNHIQGLETVKLLHRCTDHEQLLYLAEMVLKFAMEALCANLPPRVEFTNPKK